MKEMVREFHLFAGICGGICGGELSGHECGGIYGGELLGHECRAGAEIGSRRQKSWAMMTKGEILTFS